MVDLTQQLMLSAFVLGVGATVIMDLWSLTLTKLFGIQSLNYAMVGRWIGLWPKGKFMHQNIHNAPRVTSERVIGWTFHYATGVVFTLLMLVVTGLEWTAEPTLLPCIAMSLVTMFFPFMLMQPCLGMGVAASKVPAPNIARLKSLGAHLAFGVGVFLVATALQLLAR